MVAIHKVGLFGQYSVRWALEHDSLSVLELVLLADLELNPIMDYHLYPLIIKFHIGAIYHVHVLHANLV